MDVQRIPNDLIVAGQLSAQSMSIPSSSVGDTQCKSSDPIGQSKLKHEHRIHYAQPLGSNAAAETKAIYVARAAGTVQELAVGQITPPDTVVGSSGRSVTFDLKKNGTTVLSGAVTIDSTDLAYIIDASATISVAAFVAGDVFTLVVTVGGSAGTHSLGPFAQVKFFENPA